MDIWASLQDAFFYCANTYTGSFTYVSKRIFFKFRDGVKHPAIPIPELVIIGMGTQDQAALHVQHFGAAKVEYSLLFSAHFSILGGQSI